jgi:hypothetical protein
LLLTFVSVGTDQAADLGYGDEAYLGALERALRTAVKMVSKLGTEDADKAREGLLWIRDRSTNIGWGFCDAVDSLVASALEPTGNSHRKSRRQRSNTRMEPTAPNDACAPRLIRQR